MRNSFLPFSPPSIGEDEIDEVVDTLRSAWITTGPKVKLFEDGFAAAVGAPASLAVNSGTAALHLALASLSIGPGDAVITTPMTFVSSAHVIEHVGARPVFVDVEPDTLNIDPVCIREAIASCRQEGFAVRALMPVHLYGHPCDLNALFELAEEHGLAIIEDAAHAFSARYEGRQIGSFANVARVPLLTCFSFYATKNLTTAEGGMLTGPPALIEEARIWSLHGMSRDAWKRYGESGSWRYEVIRPGFKYNLTDIHASLGLHQLRRIDYFQARREEIVRRYNEAFSGIEELEIPVTRPGVDHAHHLYVLRLNLDTLLIDRDQFIEELTTRYIGTGVHFIPVHMQPYYRDKYNYQPEDFPVTLREFQRIFSLPLHAGLRDCDVEDVIEAVIEVATEFSTESRAVAVAGT